MNKPIQQGILIEFVFGGAPFRDGYTQIGSFKNDAPDWPHIYITGPIEWVNANYKDQESEKDFLQKMSMGFIEIFNQGKIDTSKDRFRYYILNEDKDTAITLGYFSEEKDGATFNAVDPLTIEEFVEFKEARNKIAEFYKDTLWFNPITENYKVFCNIVETVRANFYKSEKPDYSGVEIVNINSAFNNFAASVTSYLKHIEKRLKNRNDKAYWEQFRKHVSEQYDQNISYRFIAGLRDYIQHQAPPIHIIYEAKLVEEKPISQVDIYCSKEELLQDDSWNKTKRNDISGMDEMIDVCFHVDNMMQSLNQILVKHVQNEFSYLHESAEFIHKLTEKIPQGQDRGVYETYFVNKQIVGMTPHMMYSKIVDAIVQNNIYSILQSN